MLEENIGIAPSHIPTVTAGKYSIKAKLSNGLSNGSEQKIEFHVDGYNHTIPQNEVLAMYPPMEHIGNFAGTFPHIQFRRSTLPWEYIINEGKTPYIFLVLLKEEELTSSKFEIIEADTNSLKESLEDPIEPKPLRILSIREGSEFFLPPISMVSKLAHVRVQEHTELKDLHLPKETSIVVAHRMVEPSTKYRAFVCYYAEKKGGGYEMLTTFNGESPSTYCIILNEWSFESIALEMYQINSNKLKNHPNYSKFQKGLIDSEITTLEQLKTKINESKNKELHNLITANEKYLKERKGKLNGESIETFGENQIGNNQILEYLEYNGKNLKGYLHELELQAFKANIKVNNEGKVTKLINLSKVPLEHQLKAGGKIVSWYQGPLTNWSNSFRIDEILSNVCKEYIPDHQDYLNIFNQDTQMYDMTYSAAWQLGRLMIMHDNKVLQELKKWKYDLELHHLVLKQNQFSHLPNLPTKAPTIPDLLLNYIIELIKFRDFPIYYLLPHVDLNTEESIKYFKIDNSWILAFLYGVFSAGPKLSIENFKEYILGHKELKNIFDYDKSYYGILLQSQTIKNWPHLIVELDKSHDFHYVTNINNTLRLYITDKKFSTIEMYLKNENAHFAKAFEKIETGKVRNLLFENNKSIEFNDRYVIESISGIENSVDYANNMLYKQPKLVLNIKKKSQ